jgi:hypothetical protein
MVCLSCIHICIITDCLRKSDRLLELFDKILKDENHHIISRRERTENWFPLRVRDSSESDNLISGPMPSFENVVTDEAYRTGALLTSCLSYAKEWRFVKTVIS